jgi:hypothetical protein
MVYIRLMKNIELSKKLKISPIFVSYLLRGKRYTRIKDVAIAIAAVSGKKPIEHISPSLRKMYLKDFPVLAERIK